ncbi:winged helix-turn-helix transcriptional regulator [bacterium]|nr:winged helix-turn-helix transcriptional regulator [bacterium]
MLKKIFSRHLNLTLSTCKPCRSSGFRTGKHLVAIQQQVILQLLKRRNLTAAQIAQATGLPLSLVRSRLRTLCDRRQVKIHSAGRASTYSLR